jgi:hypothetical protein
MIQLVVHFREEFNDIVVSHRHCLVRSPFNAGRMIIPRVFDQMSLAVMTVRSMSRIEIDLRAVHTDLPLIRVDHCH